MLDLRAIDEKIVRFLRKREFRRAEHYLLEQLRLAKANAQTEDVAELLGRLAQHYCSPDVNQFERAEGFLLEREKVSGDSDARLETLRFYMYCLGDLNRTVDKADELFRLAISPSSHVGPVYTALAMKGESLLRLGRTLEAEDVLSQLGELSRKHPDSVPFGDEMQFLRLAAAVPKLRQMVAPFLSILISHAKSRSVRSSAQQLQDQLGLM